MSEQKTIHYLVKGMDSHKVEWLLGMINSVHHDVGRIYALIEDNIDEEDTDRAYALNNLDLLQELAENSREDYEEAMGELDYSVDESGEYPVLFRGKIKPFEWVHISSIETGKLPLNKQALDAAGLVKVRMPMAPLRLMEKVGKTNPKYKLVDGDYRFLGFKLNEIEYVPAHIHSEFTGIVHKTGKENEEVFKGLA